MRLRGTSVAEGFLLEHEAKAFLKNLGLPVPRGAFFKTGSIPSSAGMDFPLVAKVSSGHIVSKSDLHGVSVGIADEDALKQEVSRLMQIAGAEGVLVEEMAPAGIEVIVGGIMDPQFGPVVMFGLGGIYVELFRDVAFGLAPLDEQEALWLIGQVKGSMLLKGYRGSTPVDTVALVNILITISELMAEGCVREIDLNPLALYPEGAMVLDAKISLAE